MLLPPRGNLIPPPVTFETHILAVISRVLQVPLDELSLDTHQDALSRWDSLRHVQLILALEDEFGVSVPIEQLGDLVTIRAVITAVEALRRVK